MRDNLSLDYAINLKAQKLRSLSPVSIWKLNCFAAGYISYKTMGATHNVATKPCNQICNQVRLFK